jgi:hypothetical protein
MIYLSGTIRPALKHTMPPDVPWGADSGRFNAPQLYSDDSYLEWLRAQPIERCLFATAPDVLTDHAATVELSRPMFSRIRDLGYPVAFVAQDGWGEETTPWDEFDILFVGGSNEFKLSRGGEAVAVSLRRGKKAHMGRANSYRRLRLALLLGCDTADGTFLKFSPDINELRMLRWFERLQAEPILFAASGLLQRLDQPQTPVAPSGCERGEAGRGRPFRA